ncbi:MAG TPA: serine/threonine-protein kinase, partial [Gemmatimonadaceae bacterium]
EPQTQLSNESAEVRLRWALADDYEVLASLGSGSFGSVWRVRDLTLGREVALKLLHPHVARDERMVGRFRREAKLAAMLAHPAIVPIFDWDSRADVAWYTMELAEGGSVAELVARAGPRPLAEIAHQVDFILNGLAAAHAVGIIHRDLKPENVLIDRYRRWRLADFGIANMTGEETAGASGTPAFASPEQLLGEPQDATADCFSIAAIVAFVMTGTAPFGERDSASILARELQGDVDLTPHPPEIADWLRRGLSPSAEDRFTDAAAMQTAWRTAVQAVFERERQVPWWRRWFAPDGTGTAWSGDSLFTAE